MFFSKIHKKLEKNIGVHKVSQLPEECINTLIIKSSGDVIPCCMDNHSGYSLGNVLKTNFSTIITSDKYYNLIKNITEGNRHLLPDGCRSCPVMWKEGIENHACKNS